ncbi:protein of unknown function [Shinella sp. WSC3-e]|nr:protein of unknown function [Shinella sp. WSC3-e]
MTQAERANLLGQVVGVAAGYRAVSLGTAAELRSARGMVTSAARTLLLVHFGAGAGNFTAGQRLVRALLLLGELPADDAGDDVFARLQAEDRVGEGDLAGVLPVEGRDFEIHDQAPLLGCGAHGGRTRSVCRGAGLDGVTDNDPGALGARDCALDEDETAFFVGGDDFEVLGGDARLAHVAGHALALPDLARVLVVTRRTVRTVRDGHAVRCTKAAEVVALHGTGETLTDRGAGDVDELARDEMACGQLRTDLDEVVFRNAELDELGLRLDACGGELAAQCLCRVLHLGRAGAELDGRVAVLVLRTLGNDLDVIQSQYCYRDVLTCVVIDASHPYFLCNHT